MSIVEFQGGPITHRYLMNKSKYDLARMYMELLDVRAREQKAVEGALKMAIGQIEHMAAWIGAQQVGYSFESLGEDMPSIRDALERLRP